MVGVIGETGGLERYCGQKALIKFAGLNLYEISSGKHQGERHISKRGRCFADCSSLRPSIPSERGESCAGHIREGRAIPHRDPCFGFNYSWGRRFHNRNRTRASSSAG